MTLGAFSVSLPVSDLAASRAFYEALGFDVFGGDVEAGYLMLRHGDHVLGLFEGLFERPILTFNPGWDQAGQPLDAFTDVRDLQRSLKARGLAPVSEADEATTGPASFVLEDPDGHPVLVDQHV